MLDPAEPRMVFRLVDDLHRRSPGGGREMTKDEIDEMWGHE